MTGSVTISGVDLKGDREGEGAGCDGGFHCFSHIGREAGGCRRRGSESDVDVNTHLDK